MKPLVLFFILGTAVAAMAQPPDTLWTRTFGENGDDYGNCVDQTSDGGYIITGVTNSFGPHWDILLIKTDVNGNEQWTHTFSRSGWDGAASVQQTNDQGYIIAGHTHYPNNLNVWLIKTDSNGDSMWTRIFGVVGDDVGNCVQQTEDGGYIIAGYTSSLGAGEMDVWLIRTDNNGDTLWSRTYGGSSSDEGYSVQQTSDGGYIIAGSTSSYGAGYQDVWLIKTDSHGNQQWNRTLGGSGSDEGYSVQQSNDGGYVIAGMTNSYGADSTDVWLIKTNSNGDSSWTRTFGDSFVDAGNSVQQTTDGGYIIAGYIASYGADGEDAWLIKTDFLGCEQWTRIFGGSCNDRVTAIQQTTDGGYIAAGYTASYGVGAVDVWLIRLGAETSVETDSYQRNPKQFMLFPTYPNPFNPITRLTFEVPHSSLVTLYIYNIQGRKVTELYSGWCPAGTYRTAFNGSDLPSGIYFCQMVAGDFIQVRKLLLLR